MQDADEDITPTSTLVPTHIASSDLMAILVDEYPTPVNDDLEAAVEHVVLDEEPIVPKEPPTEPAAELSTLVVTEENVIHAAVEAAQKPLKEEEPKEEEEPSGYQVCDMESGLCYWVPNKTVKSTPSPPPVAPVVTPAVVIESVAPVEEEIKLATTTSIEVTADTQGDSTGLNHNSTLSTPSQGNGSSSGASSPTLSLTPGPRLVGKLSRERFAMFEKSS